VLLLSALAGLAPAACVPLNAQSASSRAQLVNDLADRLDQAGEQTYHAVYRLPQGATASISQAPGSSRTAYVHPGGRLVLTPQLTGDCRISGTVTACTLTPPPSPGSDPPGALLGGLTAHGLIPPSMVISLLAAAALDPGAVVTTHDTTLAGENATCVQVKGVQRAAATEFEVCVTTGGLMGSFTGVVNGAPIEVSLDRYEQTLPADAFDLPPGARIADRRPK
jgi:hypothetical protein